MLTRPRISYLARNFRKAINESVRSTSHKVQSTGLLDLILIRHGESEGNVAYRKSTLGDDSLYYGEFLKRHSSKWRLTEVGRDQATIAGEWITNNCPYTFDGFYTSEFLRAIETAGRLQIPNAAWCPDVFLRERDWGQLDLMPVTERRSKMGIEMKRKDLDRFHYAPPGGESMVDVTLRADWFLENLQREYSGKRVVVVCHGEVMWALKFRIEHLSLLQYSDLTESRRLSDHIHNGQVIWYSRTNPETGEVSDSLSWSKSVCPWNESLSTNIWKKIETTLFTNAMLLATAGQTPRLYTGQDNRSESETLGLEQANLDNKSSSASLPAKRLESHLIPHCSGTDDDRRGNPLVINRALVVEKKTRYEMERERSSARGEALRQELIAKGVMYDRLLRSAEAHNLAQDNIISTLRMKGIATKVIKSTDATEADFKDVDIVFAAGGDGTFLKSASLIQTPAIPLVGVNTDPSRSQGSLCCCQLDMTGGRHPLFDIIIDRLRNGNFTWFDHHRAKGTVILSGANEVNLSSYITNEALVAVVDPSKPTILDIGIDGNAREVVRCSGAIICTGTGSSAWHQSATNIHSDTIRAILNASHISADDDLLNNINEVLRGRVVFPADSDHIAFFIREPIINKTHHCSRRQGRAYRSISIKPLSWDGQLSIDGVSNIPFNIGSQVLFEAGGAEAVLRSVRVGMESENANIDMTTK